ncbi:hypothetical protein [Boudabousia marimammalium]|uniref:Uncharacterized protein n=1 Tax=Boudabousia marimammalium TaxID=156892 RepID=A0A1Q5PP42_9ACTO|nr:hypothetical protein [Boudabousia marimammalium]OKL49297.1 hypothetical protein BM477_04765 [Boudabousia marimammalium]
MNPITTARETIAAALSNLPATVYTTDPRRPNVPAIIVHSDGMESEPESFAHPYAWRFRIRIIHRASETAHNALDKLAWECFEKLTEMDEIAEIEGISAPYTLVISDNQAYPAIDIIVTYNLELFGNSE